MTPRMSDKEFEAVCDNARNLLQSIPKLISEARRARASEKKHEKRQEELLHEIAKLRNSLDRIAEIEEVADAFHAPAEESIVDGVQGAIESLAADLAKSRASEAELLEALELAARVALSRPHDGSQLDEDLERLLLTANALISKARAASPGLGKEGGT